MNLLVLSDKILNLDRMAFAQEEIGSDSVWIFFCDGKSAVLTGADRALFQAICRRDGIHSVEAESEKGCPIKTRHTPEPWTVDGRVSASQSGIGISAPGPAHRRLMAVALPVYHGYHENPMVEAQANARLIVRAVNAHDELVAACRRFLDSHQDALDDGQSIHQPRRICQCGPCEEARAAIEKAEGRSQ